MTISRPKVTGIQLELDEGVLPVEPVDDERRWLWVRSTTATIPSKADRLSAGRDQADLAVSLGVEHEDRRRGEVASRAKELKEATMSDPTDHAAAVEAFHRCLASQGTSTHSDKMTSTSDVYDFTCPE